MLGVTPSRALGDKREILQNHRRKNPPRFMDATTAIEEVSPRARDKEGTPCDFKEGNIIVEINISVFGKNTDRSGRNNM